MKQELEKFLSTLTNDNIEFAAQLILNQLPEGKINELINSVQYLDDCLYKSYLKELTINDLKEVITIIKKFGA